MKRGGPRPTLAAAERVLTFLNETTGRQFRLRDIKGRPTINLEFIMARLDSGVTEDQCRQVIARKARTWKTDARMREYLRPATLFNREKFEQYLGEINAEVS